MLSLLYSVLSIDSIGGLAPPSNQEEWWVGMGFPILFGLIIVVFVVVALIIGFKGGKK